MASSDMGAAAVVLDAGQEAGALAAMEPGQMLHITQGFLAGRQGQFIRWHGASRLVLEVELLEKTVIVDVPAADIQAA